MIEMEPYPARPIHKYTDGEILKLDLLFDNHHKISLIYLLKRYRWDKIYDKKKQQDIIDAIG